MATAKQTNLYPLSKDSLSHLDRDAVVDLLLSIDAHRQQLADYVRDLVAAKYGRKTERYDAPGQLVIFPSSASNPSSQSDPQEAVVSGSGKNKAESPAPKKAPKSGHTRNPEPDIPRVPLDAPPPAASELPCECCGKNRTPLRRVLQSSRYQFIPASFYFEDLYSVVYGCTTCERSKNLLVKHPEIVPNGIAGAGLLSLLSQVAVARDFDHLPFNRQSTIFKRGGIPLSRSTLSDFYSQVAQILLPLYQFMHVLLLQSKIISTDDTPVKVLDRSKSKKIKLGRKWAFLGDDQHPVNIFHYTTTRGREGPLEFLKKWKGLLQGDCFSGNIAICAAAGNLLVACLAHARRYFIKALLNDRAGCNQALSMFQSLFEIERTAKELNISGDELKLMRAQEAEPLLGSFRTWLEEQYAKALPKSSYGKALFYCLNNWSFLTQYLKDGDLKIDNNHTEREMKYIAMGRRAWLFFGSDKGAKDHAIVLSVLSTCRRHGVEPWAYLTDVILRLTENPGCDLEELLPYKWKQKYPNRSLAEITVAKATQKSLSACGDLAKPLHAGALRKVS